MHQGNWKCSGCGGAITELPFQPRSESGLTCRACWSKGQDKSNPPAVEPAEGPAVASEEMPNDTPDDAGVASGPMSDDAFAGMDATPATPGEKPRFEGNWSCAGCGNSITSLPFNPKDTSNLKCLDCFKQSKG